MACLVGGTNWPLLYAIDFAFWGLETSRYPARRASAPRRFAEMEDHIRELRGRRGPSRTGRIFPQWALCYLCGERHPIGTDCDRDGRRAKR